MSFIFVDSGCKFLIARTLAPCVFGKQVKVPEPTWQRHRNKSCNRSNIHQLPSRFCATLLICSSVFPFLLQLLLNASGWMSGWVSSPKEHILGGLIELNQLTTFPYFHFCTMASNRAGLRCKNCHNPASRRQLN